MNQKLSSKVLLVSMVVIVTVFLTAFYAIGAWSDPSVAPTGGNVDPPINTSSIGQSKSGGLILNTGGATNGLIVQTGNVGIGTTSPSHTLDIEGHLYLYFDGSGIIESDDGAKIDLDDAVSMFGDAWRFTTGGTQMIEINPSGVGIGVENAAANLHVALDSGTMPATISENTALVLNHNATIADSVNLDLIAGTAGYSTINFGDSGDEDAGYFTYLHSDNSFRWRTNGGSESMIIDNSGSVGIGTTSPSEKLEVAGNIEASGSICANGGADCVGGAGALPSCSDGQVLKNSGGSWVCASDNIGISSCVVRQGSIGQASSTASCVGVEIRTGGGCFGSSTGSPGGYLPDISGYPTGSSSWICTNGSSLPWEFVTANIICCQ